MAWKSRFRARPATVGLIALCGCAFVACVVAVVLRSPEPVSALRQSLWMLPDAELLERAGALTATRIWLDEQWWRVLTAGFLHGSWLHFGLNMLGLWTVGEWAEKAWGRWRMLALFLVSSVGGCLSSLAWAEAPMVVGASAGIFGVAGALVVARAWGCAQVQAALEPISARVLGFWLGFWLAVGAALPLVFDNSPLAQAGHVGGLVFGCAMGWGLSLSPERRSWRVASGVAVIGGLAAVTVASHAPTWRTNYHVFTHLDLGAQQLAAERYDEAVEHYTAALTLAADDVQDNAIAYTFAEEGVELGWAEMLVRRALRVEPEEPNYLDTLGWIQCKRGFVDDGRATLERARLLTDEDIPEIAEHIERCDLVSGED
ncbi:rhomboid family serine protease [Enhygromyxa salina]|uniref:Rhomboid family serine protease n=1 Tax=Enhygromyxa salina TaxID=215803 RepID=A0A0C2CTR2_9BACT|nr:rhomboid family intramembrane serine protease [Enhygromyxa salina]KIG14546.1 rhomboid family serine protease [Enhygromyxa salina]